MTVFSTPRRCVFTAKPVSFFVVVDRYFCSQPAARVRLCASRPRYFRCFLLGLAWLLASIQLVLVLVAAGKKDDDVLARRRKRKSRGRRKGSGWRRCAVSLNQL